MFIVFFVCFLKAVFAGVIINSNSGPLQGIPSLEKDVEAYLGVPFAEPPLGELRFAKPVPKKKWTDVYPASTLPPACAQFAVQPDYFMPDTTKSSEDCLYLNVWAPKSKPTRGLRPVIIYIHPGAFVSGSSNIKAHDGSHLASHGDLVVVTINYRLGAFGYYFANIEEADGNMAVHDQLMALKWVKENARHFYGNPENIILMGSSAGAYAVSGFMLSPLSQNLFNRAIILSGSMVHPFMLDDNARLSRNSQRFASLVGCSNATTTLETDPQSVVKCLKGKPTADLVKAEKTQSFTNPLALFPRMKTEFLPKNSIDLIHEGKFRKDVDVLIGITQDEGALFLLVGASDYVGPYGKSGKVVKKHRAHALSRAALMLSGEPDPSSIANYYMKGVKNRTTTGYLKMVANMLGDYITSCNTVFFADLVSLKGNNVHFYKFGFRSPTAPTAEWVGTTHLDEVQYVFGNSYHANFTEEDIKMSHHIIQRWAAFARTGYVSFSLH